MGSRRFLFLLALSVAFLVGSALNANQQFKYRLTSASGLQGDSVELHVLFDNEKDLVEGWSLGVCHDASMLTIISADNGETTQGFHGGEGPSISFYNIFPEDSPPGPGWNSGVVISIFGLETVPPGEGFDLHIATYTLIGDPGTEGVNTLVCPCDEQIGDPPVANVVVVAGSWFPVGVECGEAHILASPFLRGDCNADGTINLADPIYNLGYMFGKVPSICLDAQDTNDDGNVDIADIIYSLRYLFANGPSPPEPFPDCGGDVTPDEMDCADPLLECL